MSSKENQNKLDRTFNSLGTNSKTWNENTRRSSHNLKMKEFEESLITEHEKEVFILIEQI